MYPAKIHKNAGLQVDKEFLEQLIGKRIVSFSVTPGSEFGDNFSSSLQRVEINSLDDVKPIYIIIKSNPLERACSEFVEKYHFFAKEFFVYEKWFPELRSMVAEIKKKQGQVKSKLSEYFELSIPIFIGGRILDSSLIQGGLNSRQCSNSILFKENFLSMIDMRKTHAFETPRIIPLNEKHCRMVISELAKLHALSWVYKKHYRLTKLTDKFPYFLDYLHSEVIEDNLTERIRSVINWCLECVRKKFGPVSTTFQRAEFLLKLDHFKLLKLFLSKDGVDEKQIDEMLKIGDQNFQSETKIEPWLVGCHGDCWWSNLLFKYEENGRGRSPTQLILLDMQIYQEACPTTDLAYFLFTSTSFSTRITHENAFLELYVEKFSEICKSLGKEPLQDFNDYNLKCRYRRAKFYGLTLFLILFSLHVPNPNASDVLNGNLISRDTNCGWEEKLFGIIQELCQD